MLKVGRKCKWDEVEVGEIFASTGCWEIFYKLNDKRAMLLAEDWSFHFLFEPGDTYPFHSERIVFKLSKSVQSLWKT